MKRTTCLVCGSTIIEAMYNPGDLPLSCSHTNLTTTKEKALKAKRFPMEFYQCQICSHVFNVMYDPNVIKYDTGATIMYTETDEWKEHINKSVEGLGFCLDVGHRATVLEVGANDGSFLATLKDRYHVKTIGFDPGINGSKTVIKDYFCPQIDLLVYKPNLIVCRHTLEHMEDPRDFVSKISQYSYELDYTPYVFIEVPNFEAAYSQGRIQDLIYAHVSQFTRFSLSNLFELSGYSVRECGLAFNDEVILGIFKPNLKDHGVAKFNDIVSESIQLIVDLEDIVVWGGSGKCASFLNVYNKANITHVVDSDENKIGLYVPGTGQEIKSPSSIQPHESILIPNIWRAKEIYREIQTRGLKYKQILIPKNGKLHEYTDTNS